MAIRLIGGPWHLRTFPGAVAGHTLAIPLREYENGNPRTDIAYYERRTPHTAVYVRTERGEDETEEWTIRTAIEGVFGRQRTDDIDIDSDDE